MTDTTDILDCWKDSSEQSSTYVLFLDVVFDEKNKLPPETYWLSTLIYKKGQGASRNFHAAQ